MEEKDDMLEGVSDDAIYTKEQVKALLDLRTKRIRKYILNRYAVKDIKELDKLVDLGYSMQKRGEIEENEGRITPEFTLDELVGLTKVKEKIKRVAALNAKNASLEFKQSMNYVFIGNPGTGKTAAARALTQVFFEKKIISRNRIVEVDRSSLVGEYVGQTTPKVKKIFEKAIGGVLFIDEAYSILMDQKSGVDYGNEVLMMLNKLMEDYRGQLVVIFAGYKKETLDMLKCNKGLKSRINSYFEFEDYTDEELNEILSLFLKKYEYHIKDDARAKIIKLTSQRRFKSDYSNARELRNIFEGVMEFHALRTEMEPWDRWITMEDVLKWQIENAETIDDDLYDA